MSTEPPERDDESAPAPAEKPTPAPVDELPIHPGAAAAPAADAAHGDPPPLPPDATQEQIDRHWIDHVHRPDAPQLTFRAVAAGMLLGGIMSISNLYIGLKIGWSIGMALTSTILAFAIFKGLSALRLSKTPFGELENNTMASAASAAGYYCSAGMVSAIPALYLTQQRLLNWYELALWMSAVSFVGVLMAVPMRRQMIDIDRLKFPSGTAGAETIRAMHRHAGEASAKARALLWGGLAAAVLELPGAVGGITTRAGRLIWRNPLTWWKDQMHLPGAIAGKSLASYSIALPTSTLLYGAGAIMGIRVGLSLIVGAVLLYGGFAPWLASHGIVTIAADNGAATYRSVLAWAVWPGVMAALAASLFAFAWKWRSIARAFGSIGRIAKSKTEASPMAAVEVPMSWFGSGMVVATAFIAVCAQIFFDIPVWMSVVAVALSFVLAIVACRATGETDVTPIGPLGKVTQLTYAGLRPGHYATNLMTASITAGAASHSADLLTDLKTGYLLGGSPRRQFIAQFFGIVAGAVFCVPAYMLIARPERIGTAAFPAPAAQTWAVVADLLANGVHSAHRGPGEGLPAEIQSVGISQRPPGTAIGDSLAIIDGPNAGEYRVLAVLRGAVVLDRDLPEGATSEAQPAELRAPDGKARGGARIEVRPQVAVAPAVRLTTLPPGTQTNDYIKTEVDGRDMYYRIQAVRGDLAMLDHPFQAAEQPVPLMIDKMTLPPYATTATIVAMFFGILIAFLEIKGPGTIKKYLPSVAGLGIGWLIAGYDSMAMGVGAIGAWFFLKISPKNEERYNVAASSGIIAGASIMGIIILIMTDPHVRLWAGK